jgi:hypothetical protein
MIRRVIQFLVVTIAILGIAVWILYLSAQKEPKFYQQALAISEQTLAAEGDEFEKRVLELQNDARTKIEWQVVFTESQLNGWLAADLSKKFPNALPPQVSDLRVGLSKDDLRIACRVKSGRFKGIVQARADAFCTDVPGQIAIQVKQVGTGLLPIPINSIADRVSESLRRVGLPVEWSEIDSDPVALISLPGDTMKIGDHRIQIESIQMLEKKMVVSGKSFPIE